MSRFCLSNVGWYADACLLQLARFDHYDRGAGGLNERNLNNFGKRLLSGDDTVLIGMCSSRQHYTFVSAAPAVGANIDWQFVDGVELKFGKVGDGLSGGDW